jgi:hypothetical protein
MDTKNLNMIFACMNQESIKSRFWIVLDQKEIDGIFINQSKYI